MLLSTVPRNEEILALRGPGVDPFSLLCCFCHCYYFTQMEMQLYQQIKIIKSLEMIMLKYLVVF